MFKFKYFSLFFILSISMQCHAGITEIFDNLMSVTHWGILLSPGVLLAGSQLGKATIINRTQEDVSPELENFFKQELRKNDTSEELVNRLKFKIHNNLSAITSTEENQPHIITVTPEVQEAFNKGLDDEDKKYLNVVIRHEVAHIEHKDLYKNMAVLILSPFLAHYIFKGATYHIAKAVTPYTHSIIKSLLKLPSAAVKLYITYALFIIHSKYKEYRADKKAAISITDKEALIMFGNNANDIYNKYETKHKLNPKYRNNLFRFIYDEMYTPDLYHPNYSIRAKVFKMAAEKIIS